MHGTLRQAFDALLAVPTWLSALAFLPVARRALDGHGPGALWMAWLATVGAFLLYAAGTWYVRPDGASAPWAAVAAEFILVAPALAVTSFVLQETRGTGLPSRRAAAIAVLAGTGALLLCLIPAALVSSLLGGGSMGTDC